MLKDGAEILAEPISWFESHLKNQNLIVSLKKSQVF